LIMHLGIVLDLRPEEGLPGGATRKSVRRPPSSTARRCREASCGARDGGLNRALLRARPRVGAALVALGKAIHAGADLVTATTPGPAAAVLLGVGSDAKRSTHAIDYPPG
jgi:hypothetical protein